MFKKILISLTALVSFGIATTVSACSIPVTLGTPDASERRARSAAEARLHADVVVVGYVSDSMTIENKGEREIPVHIWGIVFPKKVLRGIAKKTIK